MGELQGCKYGMVTASHTAESEGAAFTKNHSSQRAPCAGAEAGGLVGSIDLLLNNVRGSATQIEVKVALVAHCAACTQQGGVFFLLFKSAAVGGKMYL